MFIKGLEVEYHSGFQDIIKVLVISGIFDLPAKCIVQETIQFNGQFGCSMCEIEGVQVQTDKGGSVRVFPQNKLEEPKLRSSQSVLQNAKSALTSKTIVVGVRGLTVLCMLPEFGIVWNVPFDCMHGVYQGIQKHLLSLWFDSTSHSFDWYSCGVTCRVTCG